MINGIKFSDEQLLADIANGMTNAEMGEKYGAHPRTIQTRKTKLRNQGRLEEYITPAGSIPKNLTLTGTSILVDGNGNIKQQWIKSNTSKEAQLIQIKEMCAALIQELPKLPNKVLFHNNHEKDMLAVYPLGDPHIGMYSWDKETGESWNLKMAEKVFINTFDRVVKVAPPCKQCIILNLGDLFHRDNAAGITSRSHNVLDCDGKYSAMVQTAIKIIRRMIESALSYHDIVEVWNMPGNHDDISSLFLAIALKHIYENEPRVLINDNPGLFQYKRFGLNLIGSHHGHTCKMDQLPAVMATDKAKDWGETKFRYWLTGHIHKDTTQEHAGCMVSSFRTLAARDAYAYNGGWRSGRDQKVLVFHKQYGKIEEHTVTIDLKTKSPNIDNEVLKGSTKP